MHFINVHQYFNNDQKVIVCFSIQITVNHNLIDISTLFYRFDSNFHCHFCLNTYVCILKHFQSENLFFVYLLFKDDKQLQPELSNLQN